MIETICAVSVFAIGLCIGSFLNVVVLRFGTDLDMTTTRSMCRKCQRQLRWYENIPVVSFVVLRAKCSTCRESISWQYPLVELLTGGLFLGVWWMFDPFSQTYSMAHMYTFSPHILTLVYWVLFSFLVAIGVYDMHHKIIPNAFVYPFIMVAGGALSLVHWPFVHSTFFLFDVLAGPLLFAPFYILWRVSYGQWIGLGDGKLAWGIGWMLGLAYGVSAIIMAFWIGAVVSLVLLGIGRLKDRFSKVSWLRCVPHLTRKSEVPFAPFLVAGVIFEFFMQFDVMNISALW